MTGWLLMMSLAVGSLTGLLSTWTICKVTGLPKICKDKFYKRSDKRPYKTLFLSYGFFLGAVIAFCATGCAQDYGWSTWQTVLCMVIGGLVVPAIAISGNVISAILAKSGLSGHNNDTATPVAPLQHAAPTEPDKCAPRHESTEAERNAYTQFLRQNPPMRPLC